MPVKCERWDTNVRKHKVLHQEVQQLKQLKHAWQPVHSAMLTYLLTSDLSIDKVTGKNGDSTVSTGWAWPSQTQHQTYLLTSDLSIDKCAVKLWWNGSHQQERWQFCEFWLNLTVTNINICHIHGRQQQCYLNRHITNTYLHVALKVR